MVSRDHLHLKSRPSSVDATTRLPDSLAFAFIIYFARTSRSAGLRVPTLLGTIAEDAMRYFLVIFSSHLVLAMTLLLARVKSHRLLF